MPRVLVVGGTGLAGRAVTAEAIERGHDVVVASRRVPDDDAPAYVPGADYRFADLVTGDGLEEVLEGADVLVDASNGGGRAASHVFASGSQNLLHTAARFGVRQAVLLSIVNVDRSAYPYYRAKAAQERNYQESPIETRIVRATQFHDFITAFFERGSRLGVIPAPTKISFQPIAVGDVARVLVDAAEGHGAPNATRSIGGPEIRTARELAGEWKSVTGGRGAIVGLRVGGPLGATWRAGENLVPADALDGVTYRDWLSSSVA
ncbi:SDR family oxidoreductase [Leifsonia poae]|uniref:Nucleotide-diphosphate-sugar epimerase n=1 Tax=Leifsonia poae TaxID=110933 RepID=A0A9W6HD03_9MICO|nr:NAD(P)H-binding protein [Leifsonia poae]GLJ77800.1 nucleotide-diphosphate-sugar epimerase [Leifsonia poae]